MKDLTTTLKTACCKVICWAESKGSNNKILA